MLILFVFFIPDSPRWLLSKDREDDAAVSLRRLRNKDDNDRGRCDEEIRAIKEALSYQVHKAPWIDVFRGTNLHRTLIVIAFHFFQQVCAFPLNYRVHV